MVVCSFDLVLAHLAEESYFRPWHHWQVPTNQGTLGNPLVPHGIYLEMRSHF